MSACLYWLEKRHLSKDILKIYTILKRSNSVAAEEKSKGISLYIWIKYPIIMMRNQMKTPPHNYVYRLYTVIQHYPGTKIQTYSSVINYRIFFELLRHYYFLKDKRTSP